MKTKINVNLDLDAEIKFDDNANIFVAYTSFFDIFSQGKSINDAKLALEDAVNSFLIIAHKNKFLQIGNIK